MLRCAPRAVYPLLALAVATVASQDAPLRAQSVERALYVSVLDADGQPVTGLTPDDVVVREDGRRREVLRVGPATTSMEIALLVDTSQAATRAIREIREGAEAFVTAMTPGNEIALVAFGERPTIRVDYTSSARTLLPSVRRLFAMPGSGGYLLDALRLTLQGIERREARRPVIIAVTTQGIDYSSVSYQGVLRQMRQGRASFHAIVLESEGGGGEGARDRAYVVAEGTRDTGGRRHELLTTMALEGTLLEIGRDLSSQHLVVYSRPSALIPPDRIEVTAANPDFTARGTDAGAVDGSLDEMLDDPDGARP